MILAPVLLGKALSPFAAIAVVYFVTAPARRLVQRYFPEGRTKRLLLRRIN